MKPEVIIALTAALLPASVSTAPIEPIPASVAAQEQAANVNLQSEATSDVLASDAGSEQKKRTVANVLDNKTTVNPSQVADSGSVSPAQPTTSPSQVTTPGETGGSDVAQGIETLMSLAASFLSDLKRRDINPESEYEPEVEEDELSNDLSKRRVKLHVGTVKPIKPTTKLGKTTETTPHTSASIPGKVTGETTGETTAESAPEKTSPKDKISSALKNLFSPSSSNSNSAKPSKSVMGEVIGGLTGLVGTEFGPQIASDVQGAMGSLLSHKSSNNNANIAPSAGTPTGAPAEPTAGNVDDASGSQNGGNSTVPAGGASGINTTEPAASGSVGGNGAYSTSGSKTAAGQTSSEYSEDN